MFTFDNKMVKYLKNIGIIGCGWLGTRLAKHLVPNYSLQITTSSPEKAKALSEFNYPITVINFDQEEDVSRNDEWQNLDCIIITVPFPRSKSDAILERRTQQISSFLKGFRNQIFMMSTIGIYPDLDGVISENNVEEKRLNSKILSVENTLKKEFPQLNILRLGGLMGDDRYLSKYKISEPHQLANHIHFEDIILIIERMIKQNFKDKCYNLVAPEHPTKQQIINYQTKKIISEDTLGHGKKVVSDKILTELNYAFKHPNPLYF